ncbi:MULTISPECIES: flagellar hook-basal body complex protein FliE [Fervidobacterium]|uniref:Flagellar hook-basal body complex protein FliE n=1 Tax=Fervidobacterium nodosum (strain ATCC 35602 / DSM 5306 / Rt17-B1) TaxID=381764 RepID=A7HNR8_FERNB|nr:MULTISPECIES: flagellar hook-basal body complex protein FliE [Fervidobacterium]ABS61551.1 flagellar hook-basal body complex subunit FliE [Fervidobacterium nodosum Rt17-B1]KAF2961905.1 flagellar hook-basal body protein FliE [Fervidobacterium sp. 2310opik-2]
MIERINGVNNQIQNISNTQSKSGNSEFSKILSDALQSVNEQQKNVEQMSDDFAKGKISNIHELVVEAEKASISLRLTVEVRNRIVDAYREIMRMQF